MYSRPASNNNTYLVHDDRLWEWEAISAGPESLEDYFQKGALLGQKVVLNLWYIDTRPNSQKQFLSNLRSVIKIQTKNHV